MEGMELSFINQLLIYKDIKYKIIFKKKKERQKYKYNQDSVNSRRKHNLKTRIRRSDDNNQCICTY